MDIDNKGVSRGWIVLAVIITIAVLGLLAFKLAKDPQFAFREGKDGPMQWRNFSGNGSDRPPRDMMYYGEGKMPRNGNFSGEMSRWENETHG